jgi:hypothetical protein
VGTTAWVTEGNLTYFFDASKKELNAFLALSNLRGSIEKGRH